MTKNEFKKGCQLQRISRDEFSSLEETLWTAALAHVPAEQTQRRAFMSLMPILAVLRHQNHTWPQLTKLLKESGMNLGQSTLRRYFFELMERHPDRYELLKNEKLLEIAAIRKLTDGGDQWLIAETDSSLVTRYKNRVTGQYV